MSACGEALPATDTLRLVIEYPLPYGTDAAAFEVAVHAALADADLAGHPVGVILLPNPERLPVARLEGNDLFCPVEGCGSIDFLRFSNIDGTDRVWITGNDANGLWLNEKNVDTDVQVESFECEKCGTDVRLPEVIS